MDAYINLIKKLSILSVLSTTVTESSIASASLFNDTRTTLWSRMLEQVNAKWDTLRLNRFIGDTDESQFVHWIEEQLLEYATKDMYISIPFLTQMNEPAGLHYYQLDPQSNNTQYLYYNLSPSRVLYITQRMPIIPVFPCKFSIYVEDNLHGLVEESYKRELKNEQQKKINTL
jgi:hypothetical protein|tara:strand:- start:282 stop:800 length:519 start_codon:yes stop_codon:yes gene_type:complete